MLYALASVSQSPPLLSKAYHLAIEHQLFPAGEQRLPAAWSPSPVWRLFPLLAILYSLLLLAPEARANILGVNLPAYRAVIIVFAIPWFMTVGRVFFRPSWADGLIVLACSWTLVSFMHHYGYGTGFVRAMGVVIDTAGGYFVARLCIRHPADLRLLLLLLLPGLIYAGGFMALESLTKQFIVRPAFMKVFGQVSAYSGGAADGFKDLRVEYRQGVLRAFSVFSHPIMGGMILTSTIILYLNSGIRSWPRILGVLVGFTGFFSMSSAAVISIGLAFLFTVADKLLNFIRGVTWFTITTFVVLVGLALQVVSKKGIVDILIRQTLVPQTGYYRKAIWEWGLKSVDHNRLFGIGFAEYERPRSLLPSASVDAHFLALGIRDGVIVPVAILLAMAITIFTLGRRVGEGRGIDRQLLFGLNGALVGLFIASMTVSFFGEGTIWFMAIIGMGASLAQCVFVPFRAPFTLPDMPKLAASGDNLAHTR